MDGFKLISDINNILSCISSRLNGVHQLSGEYDSVSLEYFAASIFNSLFDLNLVNLNETIPCAKAIDLIDKEKKIGVQVTIEKPSSAKVDGAKSAFELYGVDKIYVFFFQTKAIKKLKSTKQIEVWSIYTIIEYLRKNPHLCKPLHEVLKIWDGSSVEPSCLIKRFNQRVRNQIGEMERRKKFQPDLFVNDWDDYKTCRLFCGKKYAEAAFEEKRNMLKNSQYFRFLSLLDQENVFSSIDDSENGKFFHFDAEELEKRKQSLLVLYSESDEGKKKNDYFVWANRYTQSLFAEIISLQKDISYELLTIVRGAGQGKTMFSCNLAKELADDGTACCFITSCLCSKDPYEEFKALVEGLLPGGTYYGNLSALSRLFIIEERNLVIIVDAINEYKDINGAINCLGQIILDLKQFSLRPKIIVTSRNKVFDDFSANLYAKMSVNDSILLSPMRNNNQPIIDNYFKQYSISGRPSYGLNRLFMQSRLLVRLFCEMYKGRQTAIYKESCPVPLIEKYMKNRAQVDMNDRLLPDKEAFFETADEVARHMINNNSYSDVSSVGFSSETRRNIRVLGDSDIFMENSQGCKLGESKISFVFEQFRDYFLSRSLVDENANVIEDIFSKAKENLDGLGEMLFIKRRKEKKFDISGEYKFSWYRKSSVYSLSKLDCDDFTLVDENAFLSELKKIGNVSHQRPDARILSLIKPFLKNKTDSISCFRIDALLGLNDTERDDISKHLRAFSNIVSDYICGELIDNGFQLYYAKEVIRFCEVFSVSLSKENRLRVLGSWGLAGFNSKDRKDRLSKLGFDGREIAFWEDER